MWTLLISAALATDVAHVVTVPDDVDVPIVDGRVDDAAWALATPITELHTYLPTAAEAPPPGRTEVRFVQDADTLFIGIRVTGTDDRVRARLAAREDVDSDDQIGIYLDPYGDAQVGYIFYTNARGIQQDIQWVAGRWNVAWSTVYATKGRVHDDGHGYDLEIALPFRSLKFPEGGGPQTWGLIVTRKRPAVGEKDAWPLVERNHPRWFAQAGRLEGVVPPARPSGVELIPGLAVRVDATRDDTADPFTWPAVGDLYQVIRPSLDVRAGITPTSLFVGALQPDFSQVETDVAPVRLNARFAFRFEERRPFFTEGDGFFEDGQETLYSRSIVEPLYGLKAVGREGSWSFGVLHAMDTSPQGSVHEDGTVGFADDEVAGAWASNTMLRVAHDLPRAGYVGFTLTDKRLLPAGWGAEDAPSPGVGGHDGFGLDARIPVGEHWVVEAHQAMSATHDATDLLSGTQTYLGIERPSGAGLGFAALGTYVGDGYRQELGFRTQSGYAQGKGLVDWTFAGRGRLSTWRPRVEAGVFEELKGESYRYAGTSVNLLFDGVHSLTVEGGADERREAPQDAFDVDDIGRVPGWYASLAYSGQAGAWLEVSPSVEAARVMDFQTLEPAHRVAATADVTLRPVTPLRIDLLGRWTRFAPLDDDAADDVLVRGRILWQLHPQWGVRVLSQYNGSTVREPVLDSSLLLTWLLHPFTAVYAGYAERTALGPAPGTLDRAIFAKVQWMFRP